jgi:MinD-like ATPase involved in chromosome partitioning or flagellar assembly
MKLPVLCAADGAPWEARLVVDLDRGEHPVRVVRRCVDIVDLLAVALSGQARAALVAASLRRLDADAVDRLIAAGVAPVAVVRRGDSAAEDRVRALGIAYVVSDDADAAVVATVIGDAVSARGAVPGTRIDRAYGDPLLRPATTSPGSSPSTDRPPSTRGSVVAVWGPTGAPGRTTVAVTLADELSRLGSSSLLVDADVYGGVIAAVLGLLDESPGFAAACRQSAASRLDPEALAALCWAVTPSFRVLTGVPRPERWPELRPTAVESVLTAARTVADYTVVDCGFCLEADEELSFDTMAPRRNGATLAVLDAAEVVLAVGSADPIGIQRLVRGLSELRDAEVAAPVWVVLNKVRRSVVPGDPPSELSAALDRFAGRRPAALLPNDQPSLDAALVAGKTLGEVRPASPLRQSVISLAGALAGIPVRPHRRFARSRRD